MFVLLLVLSMFRMKILVYGLIMLFVVACDVDEFKSVDASVVGRGNFHVYMQESIFKSCSIITDNSGWQELVRKLNLFKDTNSDFVKTNIDFSQYDVIAVFDRIRTGVYYAVKIDLIEGRNMLFIKVSHEKNMNQQPIGDNIQSYLIVKVLKINKSIQVNDMSLDK
jgi:hypothetical protein